MAVQFSWKQKFSPNITTILSAIQSKTSQLLIVVGEGKSILNECRRILIDAAGKRLCPPHGIPYVAPFMSRVEMP